MSAVSAPTKAKVAVLGGGLAGLAASLELAKTGFEVHLFEKRNLLGGRASSFVDPSDQELIDNCQHVSMRCCTKLEEFLQTIDAKDAVQYFKTVRFIDKQGKLSTIRASLLPPPLHLLPSLFRFKSLSFREKIDAARVVWKILKVGEDPKELESIDFESWLRQQKQKPAVIECLWKPILISALNEELDRVSAKIAIHTIHEGLLKSRRGYEVGLPKKRLAEIYSNKGIPALRAKGIQVSLQKTATKIEFGDRKISLQFADGNHFEAEFLISAIPFHQLLDLLPAEKTKAEYFQKLSQLENSPITGVHLWFDREITDQDFIALIGRKMQWVFRHGNYLSLVVSASRELESLSKEQILEIALQELREIFPKFSEAKLLKSRVIKERNATFSAKPGSETLRPDSKTPIPGLYLAGDWTNTGWPATMEGAVRSGLTAAAGILQEFTDARR